LLKVGQDCGSLLHPASSLKFNMADTDATKNSEITKTDLFGLGIALHSSKYNPGFNRIYVRPSHPRANQTMNETTWSGSLSSESALDYFCPSGWRRFALNVNPSQAFWKSSSTMYHGLDPQNVRAIIKHGFAPNQCQHGSKAVYLTPSIRYAAHPRYARVYKRNGKYFQVVLQVRVANSQVKHWKEVAQAAKEAGSIKISGIVGNGSETMHVENKESIDDNFPDNFSMEFLHLSNKAHVTAADGLLVTGIMVRCLDTDPIGEKHNSWWLHWAEMRKEIGQTASQWLRVQYCDVRNGMDAINRQHEILMAEFTSRKKRNQLDEEFVDEVNEWLEVMKEIRK